MAKCRDPMTLRAKFLSTHCQMTSRVCYACDRHLRPIWIQQSLPSNDTLSSVLKNVFHAPICLPVLMQMADPWLLALIDFVGSELVADGGRTYSRLATSSGNGYLRIWREGSSDHDTSPFHFCHNISRT